MAIDPHRVVRKTRDPGAAHSIVELTRRLRAMESKYGVVGTGAVMTGAALRTADSGQRAYVQGSLGPDPGGAGVFCTDSSGNTVIGLVPGEGLILEAGTLSVNKVEWFVGSITAPTPIGYVNTAPILSGSTPIGGGAFLGAISADGSKQATAEVAVDNTGAASWVMTLPGGVFTAQNSTHQGLQISHGLGVWNTIPPATQPARAVTLTDVIAILLDYGFCAP